MALARQQNPELLTLQSDSKTGSKTGSENTVLTLACQQSNWPRCQHVDFGKVTGPVSLSLFPFYTWSLSPIISLFNWAWPARRQGCATCFEGVCHTKPRSRQLERERVSGLLSAFFKNAVKRLLPPYLALEIVLESSTAQFHYIGRALSGSEPNWGFPVRSARC